MTARATTLKGVDAGAYYIEALPNYYLDSAEPKGIWHGRGAERLGLEGEIIDGEFLRIIAGLDPRARGEAHLGRPYGEDSVRGFDVTASAPKSVSTLFAVGDDTTRGQVLAAHDAAVATVVEWIEAHAHTRYRINGEVSIVDAEGIIAATFRQHTSRALDPQLHTHIVIANRVRSPDGRWLALDARSLKMDQRTVSAIYHATLRSQLTARLGVEWEPIVNGIAEITHVPQAVLEEFSARTADVQRRIDEKLDRFIDTFDRDPTPRERWRLEREAVIDSRPPKSHDANAASLHRDWTQRIEELGHTPERLVRRTTGRERGRDLDLDTVDLMIDQAMHTLAEKQSSWRPAELTREIAAAIPTDTVIHPEDIGHVLDTLTDFAISKRCVDISRPVPDGAPLRRDGRPITESIADRALTTPDILAQEERLLAWAERRMTRDGIDSADAIDRARVELTGPQAETAAAVAGDADLVLVVGPAGTGKTTALTPAVEQLRVDGRAAFGVAPSAAAADVLASETGIDADTIDKLLTEHSLDRPPQHRYDLPIGATVIVDEAGMVGTDRLDTLARLADNRGWRVALVGDPMQFAAVGRGGMFDHLIDTHGAIELDQVHRFSNDWERDASLRLRRGDPTVADVYDLEGRLHGGTATRMERDALDAWWTARRNGETVVLAAPTSDTVARLNHAAQQRRIDAGALDSRGRYVDASGYRFWAGDEIATRRNHRQLHTDQGLMIRNRDQWTIDQVHRNGDLTVDRPNRHRPPPRRLRPGPRRAGLRPDQPRHPRPHRRPIHPPARRPHRRPRRLRPHDPRPTPQRRLHRHHRRRRPPSTSSPTPSGAAGSTDPPSPAKPSWPAGTATAPAPSHPKSSDPCSTSRRYSPPRSTSSAPTSTSCRASASGPATTSTGPSRQLDNSTARLQSAFDTLAQHDRPFRRRGHEAEIANAKRTIETLPDQIREEAASVETLTAKLGDIDKRWTRAERMNERRPVLETQHGDVSARLDDDRRIRTRQIRRNPPDRITDTLGTRPPGGEPSRAWDRAAGRLDQHQTAFGLTEGIGPAEGRKLPIGFTFSRELTLRDQRGLEQAITHQRQQALQREGPALRIGM